MEKKKSMLLSLECRWAQILQGTIYSHFLWQMIPYSQKKKKKKKKNFLCNRSHGH